MKPRILVPIRSVFKDHFLNPEIIARLEKIGDIQVVVDSAELPRNEYVDLYRDKDIVLTTWNTPSIDREVLEAATDVKLISHCGGEVRPFISPDLFDIRPDIVLCNVSRVMAQPVAEYALCVILAQLRSLFEFREWVKHDGHWWSYEKGDWDVSLLHKKVGIIGLGQIARELIKLLEPFDVELVIFSDYMTDEQAAAQGFTQVSLEEIFSTCDVITVHAAATPENRHKINRKLLGLIKPGAVFVNCARGMLVDEDALVDELRTGRFKAAVDVTFPEPPDADSPLRNLPNLLLTPHIAGPTPDQWIWMIREAVNNIDRFLAGEPVQCQIDKQRFSYMA